VYEIINSEVAGNRRAGVFMVISITILVGGDQVGRTAIFEGVPTGRSKRISSAHAAKMNHAHAEPQARPQDLLGSMESWDLFP
jgi:hypothetical protein